MTAALPILPIPPEATRTFQVRGGSITASPLLRTWEAATAAQVILGRRRADLDRCLAAGDIPKCSQAAASVIQAKLNLCTASQEYKFSRAYILGRIARGEPFLDKIGFAVNKDIFNRALRECSQELQDFTAVKGLLPVSSSTNILRSITDVLNPIALELLGIVTDAIPIAPLITTVTEVGSVALSGAPTPTAAPTPETTLGVELGIVPAKAVPKIPLVPVVAAGFGAAALLLILL